MKRVIVALGLVGGLGLALLLFYLFIMGNREPAASSAKPPETAQEAVQPVTEPPPGAKVPASPPTVLAAPEPPLAAPSSPPPLPQTAETQSPPEKKALAPSPPLPPSQEHGLLSGRYRTYQEAKKARQKIAGQNLPAFVRQKGKFYEVWVGPFSSPQEAAQAGKSLKAALKMSVTAKKIEAPVPK